MKKEDKTKEQLIEEIKELQKRLSKQNRAERELFDNEERYKFLIEKMNDGFCIADKKGTITYINNKMSEMMGYSKNEMEGKNGYNFLDDENQKILREQMSLRKYGKENHYEITLTRKDGKKINVIASPKILFDPDGEMIGSFIIVTDITYFKKTDKKLKESEETFKILSELSPNIIVIVKEGQIAYCNDACVKITGFSREELLSPDFDFFTTINPKDRALVVENYQKHLNGIETKPYLYSFTNKHGKTLDVISSTKIINYQNEKAILGILTDITQLKQAKKDAILSTERLEYLLSSTNAVIYSLKISVDHGDLEATFVSENVFQMVGFQPKDFIENSSFWINHIHPEDLQNVLENELPQIHNGDKHSFEYRFQCSNGKYIWILDENRLARDKKGNPLEIIGFWLDISEKKKFEEEIEKQNKELLQLDKAKDKLIRDVSHELKTPIAKNKMNLEILKKSLKDSNLKEDVRKILKRMTDSTERQSKVIENILHLSRLEAKVIKYKKGPIGLDKKINRILKDYNYAFNKYGFEVRMNLEKIIIQSDKEMLGHLITNLIDNSIKYKSTIATPEIDIDLKKKKEEVIIKIADNGIGIPAEEKQLIFNSFYQVEPSYEGSGIGLTISKKIVEDLGGKIWFESSGVNKGTTFYIKLPIQ